MELRYGLNPQQARASAEPITPGAWPLRVLNGDPSYLNLLDALSGWRLVREAAQALGRPVAASFKHVSPAGAALAGPVDAPTAAFYGFDPAEGIAGPLASAYVRARDADPKSSYGDFAAVSHPVDAELAALLGRVVCDGIVAPGYEPGTVAALSAKKRGRFLVLAADPAFVPPEMERREIYGLQLAQARDEVPLSTDLLGNVVCGQAPLPAAAAADLLLGLAVVRHTQSNAVCYVRDGVTLGIGAGQQSRVDCTRLAGAKAATWWLRRHPAVRAMEFGAAVRRQERVNWQVRVAEGDLTANERVRLAAALTVPAAEPSAQERGDWAARLSGVAFASDGALPFRDNVDHAARYGVQWIAEPGGSLRSAEVAEACAEHGITLVRTGLRLFQH
ncbi:phosphoribosylaminoimidazolecarboxamide formyltransferase / IMP cyclohydrolase [Streptomyces sp. DvalAA-14]|uniref:phosphoribosylaminoimidazolecarboxamide formyltransferase n=1 Tax=unclassified Streptomyces TaxID=2593676 RepID=UPI00081BC138|nr:MULTISPECIES: phosphoribosylaminoimidazolecarboxamide formyltransferase [unclassified Streptomyces]MYS24030.1 phosphoribosylaminoimidazolecarboxamide formyltransferase [Streptomyces sp. SID4948]SCE41778.1 phosphoribosylaminoimidazolecarboxamide formyltransferase / IMP cyclohydrolase [Streptomyces sp. DvalAA-14]